MTDQLLMEKLSDISGPIYDGELQMNYQKNTEIKNKLLDRAVNQSEAQQYIQYFIQGQNMVNHIFIQK